MYLRSKNLLVHNKPCAKKYSSSASAVRSARNSNYSDRQFEVISVETDKLLKKRYSDK